MNSADHFESIVCDHYEPLFRFAMSLTRSEADSQDLTQQTFYLWATKGHQLRDHTKAKTWLFTTLHRSFLVARRRQDRFLHHELTEMSEDLPAVPPFGADQIDSSQVLSALAGVDEVYQAALALFYLDDCGYKDIAAILGVPVGTVKSRVARGIAQLRRVLRADESQGNLPANGRSSVPATRERPFACEPGSAPEPAPTQPDCPAAEQPHYDEWDHSSTLLPEPLGAW